LNLKNNQYKHSDNFGSYVVCFGEHTIEVKFVGRLSKQLLEKYCEDLSIMLKVIDWQFWGYYGDLTECNNESATSRDVLAELQRKFIIKGCIIDAYTITNPVAIKHLSSSRKAAGIKHSSLDKHLFPNKQKAIEFIHSILLKTEKVN
jgi:hypothetical protein